MAIELRLRSPNSTQLFVDRPIVLADRCDGKALEAKYAPLRLIVGDKSQAPRWVGKVTKIALARAPDQ